MNRIGKSIQTLAAITAVSLSALGCDKRTPVEKYRQAVEEARIEGFPNSNFEDHRSWDNTLVYYVSNFPKNGESTYLIDALSDNSLDRVIINPKDKYLGDFYGAPINANSYDLGARQINDTDPELQNFVPLFDAVVKKTKR